MLWLQEMKNRSIRLRFWDRTSRSIEMIRKDECDDATLELVSITDADDEEAQNCLQKLIIEDNRDHSSSRWEDVQSQLMMTLSTLKKSSRPMLPRYYNDDDDDDDYDAFCVLYHGDYGVINEEESFPLQNIGYVDVAAEKEQDDFWCTVVQNECRDLFQTYDIRDIRVHQSLLVLIVSQRTVEHCGYSLLVEDALRTIASFLIDPSLSEHEKLAVLQILILPQFSRKIFVNETVLREMYAFCIAFCFGIKDLENALGTCWMSGSSGETVSPILLELRSNCLYLQEVHSIFYDVSNCQSLENRETTGNLTRSEQQWEQVKCFLFETNSVLLKDLDVLHNLYNALGSRHVVTVASVGYLRIYSYASCPTDTAAQPKYHEALHNVARFLVDWMVPDGQKFAVLKCLQLSFEPSMMTESITYKKVLSFCIDPNAYTNSFFLTKTKGDSEVDKCFYYLLLWQIRLLCCQYRPQQRIQTLLKLFWTKSLPQVRVAINVAGRMKHSLGATLLSSG